MIAEALLSLANPVAQPPEMAEPPIVVIARELNKWRGSWRISKGRFTCRTIRSSGDKAIDAIGCQAIERCISPHVPTMRALSASKLGKAEKNSQMNDLMKNSVPCMTTARSDAIAQLAARRSAR